MLGVRRAELGLARQVLQDAEIRAPFAGVIEQRYVAPGAYVQVGQPVVALVKVNPWRFRASVPEREAVAVRLGQRVSIRIEGEQHELEAVIARISPSVEMSNRSLTVEAVQPTAAESASQAQSARARATAPPGSVRRGGHPRGSGGPHAGGAQARPCANLPASRKCGAWSTAKQRSGPVETGRQNDAFAEILSGLPAGDVVVVEGFPKQAGPVEVVQKQ